MHARARGAADGHVSDPHRDVSSQSASRRGGTKRNETPRARERTNRGSHSLRLLISARETRVLAARRGPRSLPRFEGEAASSPALGPPPRAGKADRNRRTRTPPRVDLGRDCPPAPPPPAPVVFYAPPFSFVSSRRRAAASGTTALSSPSSRGPCRLSTRSCPSGCTTRAATTRRCVCDRGACAEERACRPRSARRIKRACSDRSTRAQRSAGEPRASDRQ